VAQSTAPRDGRYIEILGTYDPLTDPATLTLNNDRAKHWLSVGAQPTDRVVKLLAREGLMAPPVFARPASLEAAIEEAAAHTVATSDASDQHVAEEETAEAIEE